MLDQPLQPSAGTYLGFDYGTQYLGISVGQTITKTAQPLTTLRMLKPTEPNWAEINQLIEMWQPMGFVVGLALQPDGGPSDMSRAAERFGNLINKKYKKPVYYIEERLTSVSARAFIRENQRESSKSQIDRISAAFILESWLNSI